MKVVPIGPNCFEIQAETYTLLQSYRVIVAKKILGHVYLDSNYHDCSATTARHVNNWLGIDSKTKKEKIRSGEYILTNLNE